ncbi:DUF1631 family protein [Pseudomarimonas salicorniae]|uniref:DUF1631 domain-containing protein n=1 Tax=Pseudomarimonas salicorniae TaxID=2933270 RepID=A0ABT0GLW6_9GAMM|nr:DUF1631 family protein [Lysobacter sp. CAU 1642]MCK7595537.1 DUF1631 domain-containing protein [Lysobacter sp. CAU 1642]
MPPKVHALAEGAFRQLSAELERAVLNSLSEFEAQLFVLAEQARNPATQTQHMQALRHVREGGEQFLPRFRQRLESALAGLRDPDSGEAASTSKAAGSPGSGGLSLVETSEVDERSVLTEIAGHAEMRAGLSLFLLGQRFGVLARKPGFDAQHLPIGPAQLCRMVADAALCFDLGNEHRMLLLRQFDKQLTALSSTLFEKLNTWLASKGILPHLTYVPYRAKPTAQAQGKPAPAMDAGAAAEPAGPEAGVEEPAPAMGGVAGPGPGTAVPGPAPGVAARANGAARPASASAHAPTAAGNGWGAPFAGMSEGPRWPGMPSQPASAAADAAAGEDSGEEDGDGDQVLYDTLRHLLSNRRSLVGKLSGRFGRSQPVEPSAVASPESVHQVLDRLQQTNAAPVIKDGKAQPRSVAHLKQDVLNALRSTQPDGSAVGLPPEYNDTIELVGMLLDHLVRDLRPQSPAAGLLTKLQVPLLRVALEDKAFFNDTDHPARQLLNAVTETADWFSSDDPADQAMLGRMRSVVDRVVGEFKGDVGLLQELLDDVRQHLQVQVKRAEVAERRHVEAARGKEKLEMARLQASEAVGRLTEGRRVPRFATSLLNQSWSDVLALSMLRHGPESEEVKHQIGVAERLIEAAEKRAESPAAAPAVPEEEVQSLRGEIEEGLLQVGYHADDAQAVSNRLTSQAPEEEADDAASRTELSLKLKQRPRFGSDAEGERDDPSKLSASEQAEYQKIKRLPFGTWFEFMDEAGGATRRRLSWYSPMTGHALFVNHRGQRVGEFNLSFLAREMVAGRIRLMADANTSIVDRAWKAIVGALKTFSGRGGEGGLRPAQVSA